MSQASTFGVKRSGPESPVAMFTRLDENLDAMLSSHGGTSRPSYAVAGTQWIDTTDAPWLLKQYDGTDDITLARINATDNTVEWVQAAEQTLTSGATVDLGSKTGRNIVVTGTSTITAFGTTDAGVEKVVRFTNALTLTHHATSLILPSAANITTAAGDFAVFLSSGSGNWRCTGYQKAGGGPVYVDPDTLSADTTANLTAGYTATPHDLGTVSTGTTTPDPTENNLQEMVNGGASTFAAPTATGSYNITVLVTNNASAGAITLSGFTKTSGDDFTTTDGDDFLLYITKVNGFTRITVEAMQ